MQNQNVKGPWTDEFGVEHPRYLCGDYITDTNPDIGEDIAPDCSYFGTETDGCNQALTPDTDNFMSYGGSCRVEFSDNQVRRMKYALRNHPNVSQLERTEYSYIKGPDILCFGQPQQFIVYTDSPNALTISVSTGLTITNMDVFFDRVEFDVSGPIGTIEGAFGEIYVNRNGNQVIKKSLWFGAPQTLPDELIKGPSSVTAGNQTRYYIEGTRLGGAREYHWVFPGYDPAETEPFTGDYTDWQYNYRAKLYNLADSQAGGCEGYIYVIAENECGLNLVQLEVEAKLFVDITNPNPNCPPVENPNPDILYYPNPADDLLAIDLSLQEYKIFTIKIFDSSSFNVHESQSENVVKTIDTFNLSNGMYYLHIYDGPNLILSKTLIINH